jgi:glycerophosphoryl diester phosphodiesterase
MRHQIRRLSRLSTLSGMAVSGDTGVPSPVLSSILVSCAALLLTAQSGAEALPADNRLTVPMHLHNDYVHEQPLRTRLGMRPRSIEVDVFPVNDKLAVAHTREEIRPDDVIDWRYIRPLAEYLTRSGTIYLQQTPEDPLYLLVDFKADGERSLELLDTAIEPLKPWLTRLEKGRLIPGMVCVVISGQVPRKAILSQANRYVFIDGRLPDLQSDALTATHAPLISERWSKVFQWNGEGDLPDQDRERLQKLVDQAHQRGQLIRFWAAPDHSVSWQAQLEAGVDLINTDQPLTFAKWFSRNPGTQATTRRVKNLKKPQPLVIAHRGASGTLPEHTLVAYAAAHAMGADYIEPDVVLSKDGELICLHDVTLERVTDVEQRFPDLARDDGKWYAIDFTLAQLKTLHIDGPSGLYADGRPPAHAAVHRLVTLREMLSLVQMMNHRSGREVGVIPEPKRAAFHQAEGQSLERALVEVLGEFGYREGSHPCIIQSFELKALQRIRDELGCKLRLAFLVSNQKSIDQAGGLREIRKHAEILAPNKSLVDQSNGQWVQDAHAAGLRVVIWTVKNDRQALETYYHTYDVDGIFTDYPDTGRAARDLLK